MTAQISVDRKTSSCQPHCSRRLPPLSSRLAKTKLIPWQEPASALWVMTKVWLPPQRSSFTSTIVRPKGFLRWLSTLLFCRRACKRCLQKGGKQNKQKETCTKQQITNQHTFAKNSVYCITLARRQPQAKSCPRAGERHQEEIWDQDRPDEGHCLDAGLPLAPPPAVLDGHGTQALNRVLKPGATFHGSRTGYRLHGLRKILHTGP